MPRRLLILLALACAACALLPAVAGAATTSGTPQQAISDCNDHAQLTRYYSPSVLREALAQMPADVKEYTDCYDVIERQLLAELAKSTHPGQTVPSTSSSSGSFLPTWLIVVIVVLALAAVTFGALAIRRRRPGSGGPPGPPAPGGQGPGGGPAGA